MGKFTWILSLLTLKSKQGHSVPSGHASKQYLIHFGWLWRPQKVLPWVCARITCGKCVLPKPNKTANIFTFILQCYYFLLIHSVFLFVHPEVRVPLLAVTFCRTVQAPPQHQRHPIPNKASAIVGNTLWWQICGALRKAGLATLHFMSPKYSERSAEERA